MLPVWPFSIVEEGCPLLYDLRLEMLRAKMTPPKTIPNLSAVMLPVTMKETNPPTERTKPAIAKINIKLGSAFAMMMI